MNPNQPQDQQGFNGDQINLNINNLQAIPMTPDIMNMISILQQAQQGAKLVDTLNRGSWTQQEDDLLVAAVSQLGIKKWTDIANYVHTRTSKQCRERWHNRLNPEIKHEPFENWEDQLIVEKQKEFGNRWSVIAKYLPGRSTNAIKNRWYSGLKSQRDPVAHFDIEGMTNGILAPNPTTDANKGNFSLPELVGGNSTKSVFMENLDHQNTDL